MATINGTNHPYRSCGTGQRHRGTNLCHKIDNRTSGSRRLRRLCIAPISARDDVGSISGVSNVDEPSGAPVKGATPRGHIAPEVDARRALSRCRVTMLESTTISISTNTTRKGDVLATARVAGILAARQAVSLLPSSHPVPASNVSVNFTIAETHVDIEASAESFSRSGVEMEALTAATVAALTIYDMCKSADRTMTIDEVTLWERSGGDTGSWRRENALATAGDEETEGSSSVTT